MCLSVSFYFFLLYIHSFPTRRSSDLEATALYLIWYGLGRFFIEGMRTDSLYIGSLRVSQIVSILFILFGVALIIYQRFYVYPKPQYYTDGMSYEKEFAKKKRKYDEENNK